MRASRLRIGLVAASLATVLVAWVALASAAPADLDSTFSGDGKQTVDFGGLDRASHVAVTADGKILMVGSTDASGGGDYAITRLNADGSPDTGFDGDGKKVLSTGAGVNDIGNGIVALPNGQMIVTGQGNASLDFVTLRLNADGSADPTFASGTGGVSSVDFGGNDFANDIIRAPDGKLVIVGSTSAVGGGDMAIARLNADGTPDTTFSGDGKVTLGFGAVETAVGVAIAPDGKIVVGGQGSAANDMLVVRLNNDGTTDMSLGAPATPGVAVANFGGTEELADLALQPDGGIVAVGSTNAPGPDTDFTAVRFTSAGALDPTFSGDGKLALAYGGNDQALGLAIQQNGRIVIAGNGGVANDFVVTRLDTDGTVDPTFGSLLVDYGATEFDGDVALQPDGKILVAGSTLSGPAGDMAVTRMAGDPTSGGGFNLAASFTVPAKVGNGGLVRFDASRTTGASRLLFDFNGDGRNDFSTTPAAPFVGARFTSAGTYHPILTAVSSTGATSTASGTFRITFTLKVPKPKPPDTVMAGSSSSLFNIFTRLSPLGKTCTANSKLAFGIVEAEGCFTSVAGPDAIPPSERAVANEYYSINQFLQLVGGSCPKNLGAPGQLKHPDPNCVEDLGRAGLGAVVTNQKLKINGMTLQPLGGASIVLFPAAHRIVSSNARLSFSGDLALPVPIPPQDIPNGPINLDVGNHSSATAARASATLFSFDAKKSIPPVAGFPIDGQIKVSFVKEAARYFTELRVDVALPKYFKTFGDGPPPNGFITVQADNENGTVLSDVFLSVPEAFIGGVRLANLSLAYHKFGDQIANNCGAESWKITAQIFLIPSDPDNKEAAGGLSMAPDPPRNGISFCNGGFNGGGAELIFGPPPAIPPPQVFPGVFLNSIQFDFQLQNPLLFDGGVSLTAAKLVKADGGLLAAFASPGAPYTIRASDANGTLGGLDGTRVISTAFAAGGKISVVVPGTDAAVGFGDAYLLYAYPDFVKAGGDARIQAAFFTVIAQAGLEVNTTTERFNITAGGDVCIIGGFSIAGVSACVGGLGLVSSKGVLACLYIPRNVFEPGLGYYWAEHKFEAFLGTAGDGCKPSKFLEKNVQGLRIAARRAIARRAPAATPAATASAAPLAFTVKKGEMNKNVRLESSGSTAPAVMITAPDGETITSVPMVVEHGDHLRVLQADNLKTTWIGVDRPVPGTYMVTPLDGSPAVTAAADTTYARNQIEATVKTAGGQRLLRYSVRSEPGQVVHFYERGKGTYREIKSVKKGKGTIRFTPAPGPGGKRSIVAQVDVNGLPAQAHTLATFKAKTPVAGKVRNVSARRTKKGVAISWSRAANAARYEVIVLQRDGTQIPHFVKAKTRSLMVKGVPATQSGSVKVAALGVLGDWGKAGTAKVKATKKVKDMLLPFSELGKGGPGQKHHK